MNHLENKKVLLCITGGIAAYKCIELVRLLKQAKAEVRVALTKSAAAFVTPLTLQAVSGNAVSQSLLDPDAEAGMSHIELAKWADMVLVAPATANMLAKMSHGIADDLISTLLLATPSPVAVAPAMNMEMYLAAPTQENIQRLKQRDILIWGPGVGEQACGDIGPGRMLEPAELFQHLRDALVPAKPVLKGLKLMLTAGPTREALDPVRYLTNHSSGKMGYALAEAAQSLGAEVSLISGPVNLSAPNNMHCIKVNSGQEMYEAVMQDIQQQDVFIACAAVADYRPAQIAKHKIKKNQDNEQVSIELERNPDIVASVAALENKPFTVGFAAETQELEHYALDKLQRKNLDMIAANDVSKPEQGFNQDNNAITLYWPEGKQELPLDKKSELALAICYKIAELLPSTHNMQ